MSRSGTRSESISAAHRAVTQTRAVFFAGAIAIYALTVLAAAMTLNAYFAQTWDVTTFIQAAHRFLDGGNPFDLYAASRAAQTWPYSYPPLHAFVTAIFLWVGRFVPLLPDYLWARFPAVIADIAVGFALYAVVARKSSDESIARAAMLLWLFNPVTFYDTAVQGHFESEWLLFVLLAYYRYENSRRLILPTVALAAAVLFKQVAILFAIPLWVAMLKAEGGKQKVEDVHPSAFIFHPLLSLALFALVTLGVCLPYLLYSNDFLYMNLTYVQNVPVQTQSWVVALLALTRPAPDAMSSDFFFLQWTTLATLLAAFAISIFAARRGWSLWLTAALIAMAFFLTSRKVMGYYYVMPLPFLLVEFLPRRRFGIILATVLLTTWISLSPYYAPWANPNHIWIYAALGMVNSAAWVWLMVVSARTSKEPSDLQNTKEIALPHSSTWLGPLLVMTLGLFVSAAIAAFLQPFAANGGSPIRLPLIAPGSEQVALAAFGAMLALIMVSLLLASRKIQPAPRAAWVGVLAFAPLFFLVYYLTKESTAVFEWLLQAIGV